MKNLPVTAFCPGHISGYFRRIDGDTPARTGSIGAGIVISEGVSATVGCSDNLDVTIIRSPGMEGSGQRISGSPLLASALQTLSVTASVVTRCRLPVGAGFGLSAAALLATLTAANRLFSLGLSPHDIAGIAHEAEVTNETGLGDVAACQGGGIVIRKSPGVDGTIDRWEGHGERFFAVSRGPIPTPTILGSPGTMHQVSRAYPGRVPASIGEFFGSCCQFDDESGLVTGEVRTMLDACDRASVPAAMTMLGNGVFAMGDGAREALSPFGEVFEFTVADHGPVIREAG